MRRVLEDKFYFDWLYDRIFYAPVRAGSPPACGASSRSPSCSRPAPTSATRRSTPASLVRRLQTGLLRTYVFFLAAGAAAVVLAFLIAK